MVILMHACLCLRGGRQSVSNQHFLVVVPQPISFCILKKQANGSAWFIFKCLIPHFLRRNFLAICSFHFSVHSQQSCRSWRLTKTGPVAASRKMKKKRYFQREEYQTNIQVFWDLHPRYTIIRWCNVCCFEFLVVHVSVYEVDACFVHLPEYVHYA